MKNANADVIIINSVICQTLNPEAFVNDKNHTFLFKNLDVSLIM